MTQALIIYNVVIVLLTVGILVLLQRLKNERVVERIIMLGIVQLSVVGLLAVLYPGLGFGKIQLLSWGIFLYFPFFLLGSAILTRGDNRILSIILGSLFVLVLITAVDGFLIEPNWLAVSRKSIISEKIDESLVIALLADIQTDSPGEYESRVLALVKKEQPDLILLAGDYLQIQEPEQYQKAVGALNEIFLEVGLSPRLGIYAIQGNVDWDGWEGIFQDLDVQIMESTQAINIGPLSLTGLGLLDSENPSLELPGSEKFQIILGHSPNYSLGENEGDLLLAGHTHGGQVQLPGIGPLITLSVVPRKWASGMTEINPGQTLLVSRGIGMERGDAPRLRLFCRPELVFLTLEPYR